MFTLANTCIKECRKHISLAICSFAVVMLLGLPSAASANAEFTPAELDTLVSTIALYPDPLLVQVLTASIHGDEIPGASDWANRHKNLKGEELARAIENENLPYDESVQALIPFPTVLATMAKYQVWTDQLGDAVSSQKESVMDAVQRMRKAAYDHGHLQSNEQVKVIREKTIIIEPVQTQYIYVPVYNPHVVYYVHAHGYPGLRYHSGVWLGTWYGTWGWGSCWFEWDNHLIYVRDYRWYHHRPVPRHRPHNPPPPKAHRYEQPRPAKVPMNHRNAPVRYENSAPPPQGHYRTKSQSNNSQDEYWQTNSQSSGTGYGKATSTRSSQRNSERNGSRNHSESRSSGGFGKSLRTHRK